MTVYRLSRKAAADLDEIWDYTAENWDEDQAERYVDDVRKRWPASPQILVAVGWSSFPRTGYSGLRPIPMLYSTKFHEAGC